jgi:hypothetical protein
MKHHVVITLDYDVYRKHRLARHNISKLCNDFLASYDIDLKALEAEKRQVIAQEMGAVKDFRENLGRDEEINKRIAQVRVIMRVDLDKGNAMLKQVCKEYPIDWQEAMRRVEKG